jgi:hypothetical protein
MKKFSYLIYNYLVDLVPLYYPYHQASLQSQVFLATLDLLDFQEVLEALLLLDIHLNLWVL